MEYVIIERFHVSDYGACWKVPTENNPVCDGFNFSKMITAIALVQLLFTFVSLQFKSSETYYAMLYLVRGLKFVHGLVLVLMEQHSIALSNMGLKC